MIVGFSRHGTGAGRGPIAYLTNPKRQGRETQPPVVLRGHPKQTETLIDSLDFKHKYTSGVLSFAPSEIISSEMEHAIIDRFEKLAFAGLEPDQYDILWVRHSHAGHHELHFVTPRVELTTGKSLNIKPPGKKTEQQFDDFRSEINALYGLADPTDPSRAKNVSTPDHELKIASERLRRGEKAPDNMRELIDTLLSQRAVEGLIRSRQELLEHIKELGFTIPRAGKTYITVKDPQSDKRWRLKGTLYEENYTPSRAIEAADRARERDYSKPNPETAHRYGERVTSHCAERARYHQSRYPTAKSEDRVEHLIQPSHLASFDRSEPLNRYLRRQLGDDALSLESHHEPRRDHDTLERPRRKDSIEPLRRETLRPDRRNSTALSAELSNFERVLDRGRARNPLIERLERFKETVRHAVQSLSARTERFTADVRAYATREQGASSTAQHLRRTNQQFEQTALDFQEQIELTQSPKPHKNYSSPSRGFSPF